MCVRVRADYQARRGTTRRATSGEAKAGPKKQDSAFSEWADSAEKCVRKVRRRKIVVVPPVVVEFVVEKYVVVPPFCPALIPPSCVQQYPAFCTVIHSLPLLCIPLSVVPPCRRDYAHPFPVCPVPLAGSDERPEPTPGPFPKGPSPGMGVQLILYCLRRSYVCCIGDLKITLHYRL